MRFRVPCWAGLGLLRATPAFGQTLRIYHIDVDQASATLFVAPGGKTLLVDSGKNNMATEPRR